MPPGKVVVIDCDYGLLKRGADTVYVHKQTHAGALDESSSLVNESSSLNHQPASLIHKPVPLSPPSPIHQPLPLLH